MGVSVEDMDDIFKDMPDLRVRQINKEKEDEIKDYMHYHVKKKIKIKPSVVKEKGNESFWINNIKFNSKED